MNSNIYTSLNQNNSSPTATSKQAKQQKLAKLAKQQKQQKMGYLNLYDRNHTDNHSYQSYDSSSYGSYNGQYNTMTSWKNANSYYSGNSYYSNKVQKPRAPVSKVEALNLRLKKAESVNAVLKIMEELYWRQEKIEEYTATADGKPATVFFVTALRRCATAVLKATSEEQKAIDYTTFSFQWLLQNVVDHVDNLLEVDSGNLGKIMAALVRLRVPIQYSAELLTKICTYAKNNLQNYTGNELSITVWALATLITDGISAEDMLKLVNGSPKFCVLKKEIEDLFVAICEDKDRVLGLNLKVTLEELKNNDSEKTEETQKVAKKNLRRTELCNLVWAFAKIFGSWGVFPMPDIYGDERGQVFQQVSVFDDEEKNRRKYFEEEEGLIPMSPLAAAESKRYAIIEGFLSALLEKCHDDAYECNTENLGTIAWAMTQMRLPETLQIKLLKRLADASLFLDSWKPESIAKFLLAFGKLVPELLLASQVEPCFEHIISICNTPLVAASENSSSDKKSSTVSTSTEETLVDTFSGEDLCAIAWSISKFVQSSDVVKWRPLGISESVFSNEFRKTTIPKFFDKMSSSQVIAEKILEGLEQEYSCPELSQFLWACNTVTTIVNTTSSSTNSKSSTDTTTSVEEKETLETASSYDGSLLPNSPSFSPFFETLNEYEMIGCSTMKI